jgi:hypothetical protein
MAKSTLPSGTCNLDKTCGQVVKASVSTEGRLVIDLTTIGRTAKEAEPLAPKCQCCSAQGSFRRVDAKVRPPETQPSTRKECRNGDKCPYWRRGTCFFLHPEGPPPPGKPSTVRRRLQRKRVAAKGKAAVAAVAPRGYGGGCGNGGGRGYAPPSRGRKERSTRKARQRSNQRRNAEVARKEGSTTTTTSSRPKGPSSAPSADPAVPPVSPGKTARRKRARVVSPPKQPTLRASAAEWCKPAPRSISTSGPQPTTPTPTSTPSVDDQAKPLSSCGSATSLEEGWKPSLKSAATSAAAQAKPMDVRNIGRPLEVPNTGSGVLIKL